MSIIYNERLRHQAAQKAEHWANINRVRNQQDGATLDGVLIELAYRVAGSKDDLEAQAYLIDIENVVDAALEGMAVAQEAADAAVVEVEDSQ